MIGTGWGQGKSEERAEPGPGQRLCREREAAVAPGLKTGY